MKILILGISGTIGKVIHQNLSNQYDVYGTFNNNKPNNINKEHLHKFDVADYMTLDNILKVIKPDLIISSLNGNFEHQLNVHKHVAEYLCGTLGRCIFLSTANVFDGSPDTKHTEKNVPHPISEYGKYKYSCEQLLQSHLENRCLIVRLPRTLTSEAALKEIQRANEGQLIYKNLFKSYNTADNVAKAILFFIETEKYGIVHLTSVDSTSDDKFMQLLLSHYKKSFSYETDSLTLESYCKALGCNDTSLVRYNNDGKFCLLLESIDSDLPEMYKFTCEKIIASL